MRAGNIVETEVGIQRTQVDVARDLGMTQNGLKLRSEVDVLLITGIVERLNAHAVPRKNEASPRLLPNSEGKHSAKLLNTRGVPLHKRVENYFRIAGGVESVSQGDELLAQLGVVIDLTIKNENMIFIIRN